jgi:hypothetical protein
LSRDGTGQQHLRLLVLLTASRISSWVSPTSRCFMMCSILPSSGFRSHSCERDQTRIDASGVSAPSCGHARGRCETAWPARGVLVIPVAAPLRLLNSANGSCALERTKKVREILAWDCNSAGWPNTPGTCGACKYHNEYGFNQYSPVCHSKTLPHHRCAPLLFRPMLRGSSSDGSPISFGGKFVGLGAPFDFHSRWLGRK